MLFTHFFVLRKCFTDSDIRAVPDTKAHHLFTFLLHCNQIIFRQYIQIYKVIPYFHLKYNNP